MTEGRPRPALFELPLDDATPPLDAPPRAPTVALDAPDKASTALVHNSQATPPEEDDNEPEIIEATEEDLRGTLVGGYKIERKIGGGGFADVYQGRHQYLPRMAAVKVLRRVLTASAPARRRFSREAEVLGALDHPNVVKLVDFGVLPSGRPFLITELIEGETLRTRLDGRAPISAEEAWSWGHQLALGVQAMHAQGVVHRDLKPTNIIIAAADRAVRILDLGIARWMEAGERTRLTAVGRMLGTPMYAAPEQLVDAATAGPAADLYAVGAMIYEMLAGRQPFLGDRQAVVTAKMSGPPIMPPGSTGMEAIACELLEPDPIRRLGPASALIQRLEGLALNAATVMLAQPGPLPARRSIQPPSTAAAPVATIVQAGPPLEPTRTVVRKTPATGLWLLAGAAVAIAFVVGVMAGTAGREELAPVTITPSPTPGTIGPSPAPGAIGPSPTPDLPQAVAVAVEPAPDPSAVAPPEPEPERVERPKPASRPPRFDEAKLAQEVNRALAKRSLSIAEIDQVADPTAWRAALDAGDAGKAEIATRALVRAIDAAQIPEPLVAARIKRVLAALNATANNRSRDETEALDKKAFALKRSLKGAGPVERITILREVAALEKQLGP